MIVVNYPDPERNLDTLRYISEHCGLYIDISRELSTSKLERRATKIKLRMADTDDSGVSLSNLDHSSLSDSTPLVFQCSNCNIIVGDSLSWVSADKIMRTVALSGWIWA